jgi:hypothetical protein
MNKTYTVMNVIDGKFIGIVYDSTNNQELYRTSPKHTQLQATLDVNNFLTSSVSNTNTKPVRATITNTTTFKATSTPTTAPRRCCGR